MSGHTDKQATGAEERLGQLDRILTWHASKAMLPLVGRICDDLIDLHLRLSKCRPELSRLNLARHSLDWAGRSRRYSLEEEVAGIESTLKACRMELDGLGVAVLDEESGLVGFPTLVNDRCAFFSWMPGEDEIETWNYAGERRRRDVPDEWRTQFATRGRGKAKPRKKG